MNRRQVFKPLVAGALAGSFSRLSCAEELRPTHAESVPHTPFDAPAGTWTLAVFPDSQNLTESEPQVFIRQAEWVAAHRESHDIRFVIHLGDITDDNLPAQWSNAKKAMGLLNEAGVGYSLLPGNHDLGENGRGADRGTLMNEYFTHADYSNSAHVDYFEEGGLENSAHGFRTPHGDFLVISLEFGPRDAVVEWANRIAARYPSHQMIVATHAYTYSDDTRYDYATHKNKQSWNPHTYGLAKIEPINDGEGLWQKLLSRHPRMRFALSGHVLNDGAGRLSSEGAGGQQVHQILSNYQHHVQPERPFHGGGYFRLMRFLPDRKTVRVKTYSPWLDQWLGEPGHEFELVM